MRWARHDQALIKMPLKTKKVQGANRQSAQVARYVIQVPQDQQAAGPGQQAKTSMFWNLLRQLVDKEYEGADKYQMGDLMQIEAFRRPMRLNRQNWTRKKPLQDQYPD